MTGPRRVAVIGAGMVGLSTAWFLQERGVETVVFDRDDVASGSSWGNAGWLTPSMATPLPEPSVLRYGLRAMLSPSSPVYIPPSLRPRLLRFLLAFARNCTQPRWERAMAALAQLNQGALQAYEQLEIGGTDLRTRPAAPLLAGYRDPGARQPLVDEFRHIAKTGQHVGFELLGGDEARSMEPAFSQEVQAAIRIDGQRFLEPAAFVRGLGDAVLRRGGQIATNAPVRTIADDGARVRIREESFDAAVIATGARLDDLAHRVGVKRTVQAGRGYSFTVAAEHVPDGPLYFPAQRVACTPVDGRLRLAGMMEFRPTDAPLDPRRIAAMKDAVAPLLRGVDLDDRQDEWVGARPCTADGLPLAGRSRHPRVFIAGGHGMWGMTLGPVTGKHVATQVATGETPTALRALDPLR
jgi:D-amino-acid dehydrogenase